VNKKLTMAAAVVVVIGMGIAAYGIMAPDGSEDTAGTTDGGPHTSDSSEAVQTLNLDPPSTSECEDSNGDVSIEILGIVQGFDPNCAEIESGDRVTWTNNDAFPHDPGDGTLDQSSPVCFNSGGLDLDETYSAEFHWEYWEGFGEETIVLRNITQNGEHVDDVNPCGPDRTPFTENEDGDIALRYKCWVHEDDPDMLAWLVINI